ncbi:dual specificity protein phosphatase 18 [Carassius gibelio]|uniref:dual specificity protein phosphatase 18 n=1 Tax=Carassius gibelio TaxID=101364 RepID=UPI0022799B28|nr:dual specificity protein phosphatase 18 [Carassius gibelio]XP_052412731.1 dual specificity protein phosphatase 18 [Carassius gibelio]XP_052412732.1 dual specificity protein phosphatase 18 [Carassius gibelio]XP_052412733.1 dual specificity protein phosphatase 18 [Carassius gibelio]
MPGRAGGLGGFAQITECLYIGNSRTASDSSLIGSLNITCVINTTLDVSNTKIPTVDYMHVPVADDPQSRLCDYFDSVADKIQHVSDEDGRVLLHCNAGVSRSATLCLAYLMKHRHLTLAEAHALLKSLRPIVRPNSGFWRQLIEYEHKLHGKNTVSMINSPLGHIPDLYERETRGLIPL